MISRIYSFIFVSLFILINACSDVRPFIKKPSEGDFVQQVDVAQRPNHADVQTFYALGDWGTGKAAQKAVAAALGKNIDELPTNRTYPPFVIELGDNVYEDGLPEGWNNDLAKKLLRDTFGNVYKDVTYNGEELIYHIIPGNHDYNGVAGGQFGWGDVIHQETTAEAMFFPYWQYYPIDPQKNRDSNDSTDYQALKSENIFLLTLPQKVELESKEVLIIALDTQVILDLYERRYEFLINEHWQRLENLLQNNDLPWKIIIGHHPLRSHGRHGGFIGILSYPYLTQTFLFSFINEIFVAQLQDLDNRFNKEFQRDLVKIIRKYNVPIYLSGHDHSLQFLNIDARHLQIISGSAAKLSAVSHDTDTIFSHEAHGFVRFDVTPKEMWIEFFEVNIGDESLNSTAAFKITK